MNSVQTVMKVTVHAGLGWPEVWAGKLAAIPRVGDELDIQDHAWTVHSVMWLLPKRGTAPEVVIYAK